MGPQERNKRFVLVVDRNIDDRFSTSMLIQRLGYNTCTAGSAEEAVEFLCVAPPAAVVTEGGSAGSGLLAKIKKDARFADTPVIVLSAFPDSALEGRARKGEIAAFLRKPLDAEAFYRAVQEVIEKGPRRNLRIATSLRARLEDDFAGAEGYVTALSEFGMFFRTLDPQPAATRLPVSLEIKGRTVTFEALVLYAFTFDEGPFKEPGMGMKFVQIAPEDQSFILEQVGAGIAKEGR